MPKIKIHRKKDLINRSKVFEVFVDGTRIGYLSDGETNEFDVPAGQHKIRTKMGLNGSNNLEFNIFNKESRSFAVSVNYISLIVFIILIIGACFLQSFLMKTHKGEQIHLYSFLVFITLGAILGRNTLLKVKEEV